MTHKREPLEPCRHAVEIRPEPPAPVRRAIEQAIATAEQPSAESAWRLAGVEESVAGDCL
jgi:hypothetical protein